METSSAPLLRARRARASPRCKLQQSRAKHRHTSRCNGEVGEPGLAPGEPDGNQRSWLVSPAECGLALPQTRQAPNSGAAGVRVGAEIGIDEVRPPCVDGGAQRIGQIARAIDLDARD